MKTDAMEIIKKYEGLRLKAYLCPAKVPTIGYGHTKGVNLGQEITQEQAEQMLSEDIDIFVSQLKRDLGSAYDSLTPNQQAAIVSFVYNVGIGNFSKSTLKRKLIAGDYKGAATEFGKWVFAGGTKLRGLVRRREEEANLFLKV